MSRNRGNRFGWSERGIGSSGEIASLGKARRQGGSSITFVQVSVLGEGYRYPSFPLGLEYRVVYRSWIFGFDSGIPRVTISGRFYDWTGSRGLHLLVSEPGYAIIGTAPIAYSTIENVVLVKQLEQLDHCSC
ncbi:hypothetical protein GQ457_15G022790 [Hibiscus cannabinus]